MSVSFVAVVDPFSTGAVLADKLVRRGYQVIAVYSAKLEALGNLQSLVPQGLSLSFAHLLGYNEDVEVMISSLINMCGGTSPLVVLAGAETGVELADILSEKLGLLTNGTLHSDCRRNKYLMGEAVRESGVRAVKQLRATSWIAIEQFLEGWTPVPFKVVLKPMDSAGSDDVTLCCDMQETQQAFTKILGKVNSLGLINTDVLVQEFLDGQEYVIDTVSRNGKHKVVAIWAYDRRAVNGAPFVCHGQRLLTVSDDPHCRALIHYQLRVLDALGIRNGPTHGEVKWTTTAGPVLVEVGARCHGAEGSWIDVAQMVYGYNQAEICLDAYLDYAAFEAIPDEPSTRTGYGRVLFIIVHSTSGIFQEINPEYMEEIRNLSSFLFVEVFLQPGRLLKPTIDCFGFGGLVRLYNVDLETLCKDYERIREMESGALFLTLTE